MLDTQSHMVENYCRLQLCGAEKAQEITRLCLVWEWDILWEQVSPQLTVLFNSPLPRLLPSNLQSILHLNVPNPTQNTNMVTTFISSHERCKQEVEMVENENFKNSSHFLLLKTMLEEHDHLK